MNFPPMGDIRYEKNDTNTRCTILMKNRYIVRYDIYNFGIRAILVGLVLDRFRLNVFSLNMLESV